MAKKEQRSLKDKARARRLKDPNAGKHKTEKTRQQKALEKAQWEARKEQGVAGLAGAGRAGRQPSKKEKADRRRKKHKGQLYREAGLHSSRVMEIIQAWLMK